MAGGSRLGRAHDHQLGRRVRDPGRDVIMSFRTPLARARGLGSARTVTGHRWAQRLTAPALIPLSIWFFVSMITFVGAEHAHAFDFNGSPPHPVSLLPLPIAVFPHAP